MKFLDLFAGIGGFRLGMERAGHECVGYVEIDKFARKSYEAIHNTEGEWTRRDITQVSDEEWRGLRGTVDVICGGFPCQAFSIAGKRRGFEDTRGTLFFEVARATKQIQPRILLLENVKGLLSHNKGQTFATILTALDELGYDAEWQVLNSKNFGVPQNRERVFIVGHLRGTSRREIFPLRRNDQEVNQKCIEKIGNIRKKGKSQSGDVVSTNGLAPTLCSTTTQKDPLKIIVSGKLNIKGNDYIKRVYGVNGLSPALPTKHEPKVAIPVITPDRIKKRQNGRRFKENNEEMFTLTSQDRHGVLVVGMLDVKGKEQVKRVYDSQGISPTLTTMQGGGQEPKILQKSCGDNHLLKIREATKKGYAEASIGDSVDVSYPDSTVARGRVGKQQANTILTGGNQGVVTENFRIRKLTPRECWRLQGFPDWTFDRAAKVNSDSQLYKQAGNAVTVNVIEALAKKLEETE